MNNYKVTFERIGRGNCVNQTEQFQANSEEGLAEAIYRFCKPKLASQWFEVSVNGESGLIEGGRFGRFTVEEATS